VLSAECGFGTDELYINALKIPTHSALSTQHSALLGALSTSSRWTSASSLIIIWPSLIIR
jgi:hypothetical protein